MNWYTNTRLKTPPIKQTGHNFEGNKNFATIYKMSTNNRYPILIEKQISSIIGFAVALLYYGNNLTYSISLILHYTEYSECRYIPTTIIETIVIKYRVVFSLIRSRLLINAFLDPSSFFIALSTFNIVITSIIS